ncbi:MAG: hypothetical protein A2665_00535 [Candidatus Zambryskibacteria bacterium RIFCSPHIGHO2_01_FULL_46_30]|uniref:Uncharacterized protein n=1 Tax=Candidatus Zambryskibacteria bacterium RIFCSPHIGHO2_01_FULL_46_30 TaxID=1802739 RepID=A0A1G2T5A1_9BACT|nr:MAG: hypothetical protein A2665_00535 [Candidatus Zambryskibacteria bacterium RIFCSPHIGHO2_01_FULL_46_30]OHB05985.1 MAG: hypothetical protein A3B22_01300 [Candidatus Zambryskibacteria bacterium RIFCSPLOWO2_01_FULL_47_33]
MFDRFIIRVDRSVRPVYPDWMKKVMHSELEGTGPAEYDLSSGVEQWLHNDQKTGVTRGQVIYDYLKTSNELADQLELADLLAIQAKGIKIFRKLFKGKAVYGWKSVVQYRGISGDLSVPCLCVDVGRMMLYWHWLSLDWDSRRPALRFGK